MAEVKVVAVWAVGKDTDHAIRIRPVGNLDHARRTRNAVGGVSTSHSGRTQAQAQESAIRIG